MKRGYIILMTAFCFMLLSGCKKEESEEQHLDIKGFERKCFLLTEMKYKWDELSQRSFQMDYASYGNIGIGFEKNLYSKEEENTQLNFLLDDLDRMNHILGTMSPITVYVVGHEWISK